MKVRHSIVTRFALFFTGLIVFAILLSGFLVYEKSAKVITDYSKDRIMHSSELAEQAFYALLNEVSNDIAVVASNPTLTNYVFAPTEQNLKDLNDLFGVTLENKASYFQIRLIGLNNNGKEIIRFDKANGEILKSENLQEKGDREYFKEAIKIKKGELYFSKINLNEEYGVISIPQTPTLRAASPIYNDKDEAMGVVVINVDLNQFFKNLDQISGSETKLYIIDNLGQYIYASEKDKIFGLQLDKNNYFNNDFNVSGTEIISGNSFNILKKDDKTTYLSYSKELAYYKGTRKLNLISNIEENTLLKSAHILRANSIKILLLICLISMILSWLFTNFFSNKIKQVTLAMSNYDKGLSDEIDLPVERKDEIGVLARTFKRMKNTIDQQVNDLNKSLKEEKSAKDQRDEFLQNMSHEMRTPLNTILGLTQLLRKNSPNEAQKPIINSLERSTNNLASLVYDVLDHQKLTDGKVTIKLEPANIASILKDIHASYQYDAIEKGLKFNVNIDEDLEKNTYLTDPLRLSQIVTNLVVNAIKYTKQGHVQLEANVKDDKVEIKVADTGIGILPENLDKINDRFFREKEDLSGRYGGYGLGLSIVKQLVALFSGELNATSKKNVGSKFIVTLPLLVTDEEIKEKTNLQEADLPELKKQYTVIHVEDDALTHELIRHLLDDKKIKLLQFKSLDKALKPIRIELPDLIISDIMLEGNNVASHFKEIQKENKVTCPLLIVSALDPSLMKKISNYYLQKPFKGTNFKDIVYSLLLKYEYESPNLSNIYENYDHDTDKIKKVVTLLHDEFENYLQRIETAVKNKDQKEWESILHKMINHINNLKLQPLSDLLTEKVIDINETDMESIRQLIKYYMACFRVEGYLI